TWPPLPQPEPVSDSLGTRPARESRRVATMPSSSAAASIGSCSATRWRDINSALMPILFLIVFIDLVGFVLVIPLLPFYAARFAALPLQLTTLFATYSLMSMVMAPLWGRLCGRVGRR